MTTRGTGLLGLTRKEMLGAFEDESVTAVDVGVLSMGLLLPLVLLFVGGKGMIGGRCGFA